MRFIELTKVKFAFILLFWITPFIFLTACGGTRSSGQIQNFEELQSLVASRNFEIEQEWANPVGGGNINLIGNPNFIRFSGDSVEVFLPYFGVRHSGGGYGGEGGIKYEGLAENLTINENAEKRNIELEFEGDQVNENLEFHIKLFSNGSSYTSVNTTQRASISYQGNISRTEDDEMKE